MMHTARLLAVACLLVLGPTGFAQVLPDVPEGAQAVALNGIPRYSPEPPERLVQQLDAARAEYEASPDDADNIIWYGRRRAYTGDYRGAIETFSEGIEKFPDDARMYRHRGHRYISIREFDRAIADLEKAAELIEGTENEVEPDGAPNGTVGTLGKIGGDQESSHLGLPAVTLYILGLPVVRARAARVGLAGGDGACYLPPKQMSDQFDRI